MTSPRPRCRRSSSSTWPGPSASRTKGGSALVVVDGPYPEAKEVVGGYDPIEAKRYADAVLVVKTCPHAHLGETIDVRRVDDLEGA